ncbi:MAG: 30S ribosomal protein S4 [Nanoarchaeota archaeon]|nr:30S ribosomal protein S4 [Nanoarchaeota archaeon]|tara:strand:- start:1180 stop:1911 length:732 start_codon:yes stop_codon:yes gene_type:complete
MGSPKKPKKKYKKPLQIWQSDLIEEQKELIKEYGLKNKKEIWKAEGFLKTVRNQAKVLTAAKSEQATKEKKQLVDKLIKLGLIPPSSQLDTVLSLDIKSILDRRLQTVVFKKGLAKSIRQARQFIAHGHVALKEEKINVPSYLVPLDLENKITFNPASIMSNDQHPERAKEASKREDKDKKERSDETDIFAGDKTTAIPVTKAPEVNPQTPPTETKEVKKVDEATPTENKTRENEDKSAGKAD